MHSEDMQLMMGEMRCFSVAATDGRAAVARLLKVGLGGVVFQHSSLLFMIEGEEIFRCDWRGRQGMHALDCSCCLGALASSRHSWSSLARASCSVASSW